MITILDCYTDEPSGLGVPPYLGTYPRYLLGCYKNANYLTIDDLRLYYKYDGKIPETRQNEATRIGVYNLTKNHTKVKEMLEKTKTLIIIIGVNTPGKYLSAIPGTIKEIKEILSDFKGKKILTGPIIYGTGIFGGRKATVVKDKFFHEVKDYRFTFEEIYKYSVEGAELLEQIPDLRILEIELGKGCSYGKCSFCTEPLKSIVLFRDCKDVLKEMKALYGHGARYFRLGKQTCFYSYPWAVKLLESIHKEMPEIKLLHIDNVNPINVVADKNQEITKAIIKYCSPGNIAAFGVETFDRTITKDNKLNCAPEMAYKAVKILNEYGKDRGENGMPKFLPGINIIFGLKGESKGSNQENIKWLKRFLDENLWLRRINIRQVVIFPGTEMAKIGLKYLRKNKKYYWTWRRAIREEIDLPMLKRIFPIGLVLKDVYTEVYQGQVTFGRQFGTYPIIIGVKGRLPLKRFYNVRVTGHMLRSISAEILNS
ncbi:radical SAM protein [Candidatus Woesearchaeota archaeon]|nr:radical SAM protein [Candidatus Woesearchaeota archaeon]